MSKLSRFKKRAIVKLPPLMKNTTAMEDDDDFKTDNAKPLISKVFEGKRSPDIDKGKSQENDAESIYFNSEGEIAVAKRKVTPADTVEINEVKKAKTTDKEIQDLLDEQPAETQNENEAAVKTICPFCSKKLKDKLSGTTHVKSCGKNFSTERIIEALQLQEKQVKEWEKLGIAHPGFACAKSKPTKSRNKKKVDPDMELAMALSVSLHEEVRTRKMKENEFLVENGLENEVEKIDSGDLKKAPMTYRVLPTKKPKIMLPRCKVPSKKGKKDNLQNSKLYTTTEQERKNIINERVGRILEETGKVTQKEYYVCDKIKLTDGVPKRLSLEHKNAKPLWNLAELEEKCTFNKPKFVIQDIIDIKEKHRNESMKEPTIKLPEPKADVADAQSLYPLEEKRTVQMGESSPMATPLHTDGFSASALSAQPVEPSPVLLSTSGTTGSNNTTSTTSLQPIELRCVKLNELPQVVQSLMNMLSQKIYTDIILFGQEEKPIYCHKLLLRARCPSIMENVVKCKTSSGNVREIISLMGYSHAVVKAFVAFVYSGQLRKNLSSQQTDELRELMKEYGMEFVLDEIPPKRRILNDLETQTELVHYSTGTQTEDENLKPIAGNCVNESLLDMFEKSEVGGKVCDIVSSTPTSASRNCPQVLFNTSRELFTTIWNDEKVSKIVPPPENRCDINDADSVDMIGEFEDSANDTLFDELAFDLEKGVISSNPTRKSPSAAKKRIRSLSCVSNNSNRSSSSDSMTATQVALYWRKQLSKQCYDAAEPSNPSTLPPCKEIEPATENSKHNVRAFESDFFKKYKLQSQITEDSSSILKKAINTSNIKGKIDVVTIDDSDEDLNAAEDNGNVVAINSSQSSSTADGCELPDTSLSWEDTYLGRNSDENDAGDAEMSIFTQEKSALNDLEPKRNIIHSPLRSSMENARNFVGRNEILTCYSPLNCFDRSKINSVGNTPLPNLNTSVDAFAGDHDDSVFAKIPEDVFNRQAQEEDMVPIAPDSPVDRCSQSKTKGRGKTQAMGKKSAHGKQCKRRVQSQELSSVRTPPSNAAEPNNGRTPMLNYSTIDTPILKKELKRFGLKPLPRSKAKVVLRHIYKETHKD